MRHGGQRRIVVSGGPALASLASHERDPAAIGRPLHVRDALGQIDQGDRFAWPVDCEQVQGRPFVSLLVLLAPAGERKRSPIRGPGRAAVALLTRGDLTRRARAIGGGQPDRTPIAVGVHVDPSDDERDRVPSGDSDGSDTEIRRPMSEGRMTSTVAKHQPALPRAAARLDRSRNTQNFWAVLSAYVPTRTPRTAGSAGNGAGRGGGRGPGAPRARPHGFLTSVCHAACMRRGIVIFIVISSFALVSTGCKPPGELDCTGRGTTAHRNLRYTQTPGTVANLQSLDLYLPVRASGCGPAPLVVYVHGGGFVNGDKANQITNKVNLFNGEGWAFASLNYRLVGSGGVGPRQRHVPGARAGHRRGDRLSGGHAAANDIDAGHVMTLGHSSGAFLVALEATDGSFLQGVGRHLDAVVCTAPLDTTYDITAQITSHSSEEAMYRNAFGNDPAVWDRVRRPTTWLPARGSRRSTS